jgi:hypothetical protein
MFGGSPLAIFEAPGGRVLYILGLSRARLIRGIGGWCIFWRQEGLILGFFLPELRWQMVTLTHRVYAPRKIDWAIAVITLLRNGSPTQPALLAPFGTTPAALSATKEELFESSFNLDIFTCL